MNKFKFILIISAFLLAFALHNSCNSNELKYDIEIKKKITKDDPPCLQMYYYIKKYAKQYDIPLNYAFGLAYEETGYRGPFHWEYKHGQTSCVGALGPMQIMPTTAEWMEGKPINSYKLRENIELNVRISMKLLRHLKDRYKDWNLVFGCYNTGRPCINEYARDIYNKNYIWDK